ncbi:uncharacterized protein LOC128678298 [Plodia interpunctella]|uniref:uncharacterized protein LOC128678298 n=1 Tax=Plodia interpunctella TaxID=58824 RepID=UPI00236825F0|nr:uncharacterized protein LOC128678298 [Plodia interpunctella]
MWKFVSRRLSVTCERGFNQFENRSPGIVNQGTGPEEKNNSSRSPCRWFASKRFHKDSHKTDNANHWTCRSGRFGEKLGSTSEGTESQEINKRSGPPCRWFSSRRCWDSFKTDNNDTNQKKFNFDYLNRNWLGAITWSGVLVIGWYTSQLAHLKLKYRSKQYQEQCKSFNNIVKTLHPYILNLKQYSPPLTSSPNIDHVLRNLDPKVEFVSNDNKEVTTSANKSDYGSQSTSSNDEFQDTLNYIENKLGWAAIQNGQLKDGLQLLRSAANRNHAPALYNLGLCYEMGIGLDVNENKAMEFYRLAATLQHPDALYNLSVYYAQGRGGLTKNKGTATRLLRLAAVQGHQIAKDALVFLEEDETDNEKETELNSWSYQCSPFTQNGVGPPTLTSLFVQNVNYVQSH